MKEYLELFGLDFFDDFALWLSAILYAVEIFYWAMLLIRVYKKVVAVVSLIFMFGFIAVIFYLDIYPSSAIEKSGCFGGRLRVMIV